jgi:hypothetical protein
VYGRFCRVRAPCGGRRNLGVVGKAARRVRAPRSARGSLLSVNALGAVVACCKSNDGTAKARRYRFLKQSNERTTYPLPDTKENPIVQVDTGRNYYPTSFKFYLFALLFQEPQKSTPWDLTFSPEALRDKPNQVKENGPHDPPHQLPCAPCILQMDAGDGGAAGAVALATSAEKKREKRGLEMKISNNFGSPCRNPPRAVRIGG